MRTCFVLPNLSISAFMGLGDRGDFEAQGPLTGCSRLQAERRHTMDYRGYVEIAGDARDLVGARPAAASACREVSQVIIEIGGGH